MNLIATPNAQDQWTLILCFKSFAPWLEVIDNIELSSLEVWLQAQDAHMVGKSLETQ